MSRRERRAHLRRIELRRRFRPQALEGRNAAGSLSGPLGLALGALTAAALFENLSSEGADARDRGEAAPQRRRQSGVAWAEDASLGLPVIVIQPSGGGGPGSATAADVAMTAPRRVRSAPGETRPAIRALGDGRPGDAPPLRIGPAARAAVPVAPAGGGGGGVRGVRTLAARVVSRGAGRRRWRWGAGWRGAVARRGPIARSVAVLGLRGVPAGGRGGGGEDGRSATGGRPARRPRPGPGGGPRRRAKRLPRDCARVRRASSRCGGISRPRRRGPGGDCGRDAR